MKFSLAQEPESNAYTCKAVLSREGDPTMLKKIDHYWKKLKDRKKKVLVLIFFLKKATKYIEAHSVSNERQNWDRESLEDVRGTVSLDYSKQQGFPLLGIFKVSFLTFVSLIMQIYTESRVNSSTF